MEGLAPGSDGDVIKAEGDLLARTVASEPQKLRHHLRLVSADGLKMAAPNLDGKKWPEIGEESRRKDKAKDDVLREMRKAVADKNLDSLQVMTSVGGRCRYTESEFDKLKRNLLSLIGRG